MSQRAKAAGDRDADRECLIADLEAVVEALDRRLPRVERLGERQIARDAAVLRQKAVARLEALRLERR